MIFTKTLQKILKQDLTIQIMNQRDQNNKVIGLIEDELDGKIMTKFVRLSEKENLNLEVIKFVQKQLSFGIKNWHRQY